MSEKLAVNVVTQEQWDDVSKRLERKWIHSLWDNSERCISLDDLTNGIKKFYIGEDYKIISYEEFIKDRIDSIEDIERLWKEERLDKVVTDRFILNGITDILYNPEAIVVANMMIYFEQVNIEHTQKLIKKEKREMTKSDLKTGMILKLRNKNLGMVLLNTSNGDIISGNAWCGLENYRENLTHINDPFYDIVEIFEPTTNMGYLNRGVNIKYDKKSIWKRKEKSSLQLKLEELEAKSLKISKKQQEITEEIARVRGEM